MHSYSSLVCKEDPSALLIEGAFGKVKIYACTYLNPQRPTLEIFYNMTSLMQVPTLQVTK